MIALKRIDLTGEFLKRYARLHPETQIRWTHFGTGVLLEHVKTLAEEDAPENFHAVFEGAVENREILRRYAAGEFDVFVSLSRSEGMPVSAIEAMSCGIVPLCTDAGGTRDAVDAPCGALLPVGLTAEASPKHWTPSGSTTAPCPPLPSKNKDGTSAPGTTTRLSTAPWIPWHEKNKSFPGRVKTNFPSPFFPDLSEISRSQKPDKQPSAPLWKGRPNFSTPFPGPTKKTRSHNPFGDRLRNYTKP